MKSVLILTASFGEGHNAAARNLCEAIHQYSPETTCVARDIFLESYGWMNRLTQWCYLAIINHTPIVWEKIFEVLDRTQIVEWHMSLYAAAAKRLQELITELKPDIIVSVYPGCNHLLDYAFKDRLVRPFRTVTIITDSITINSVWLRARSDFFIVANQRSADVVRDLGVPEPKIKILGFPVPLAFSTLESQRSVPPAGGLWKVLYVINSGKHIAPEIVRKLLEIPKISLTVTVGRDEALHRVIASLTSPDGRKADVLGWTPDMPRLMAENHLIISKAGGATVQETLAARTPMIITQIVPGQEEGNAKLLIESDAGVLAVLPADIANAVRQAFANDGEQWQSWLSAVEALSRPASSREITEFLAALE